MGSYPYDNNVNKHEYPISRELYSCPTLSKSTESSVSIRFYEHWGVAERPSAWLHDHGLTDVKTAEIALQERIFFLHLDFALDLDFEIINLSMIRVPGVLLKERPDRLAGMLSALLVASAQQYLRREAS